MTNVKLQILIFILLEVLLFPLIALAAGLVPCGGPGEPACELCHFFVLIDNIVDFFLLKIVLPVATLMIVVGGMMFLLSAGNPEKLAAAKKLLSSVVIGLIIIFAAWAILGLFFQALDVANWAGWQQGFYEVPCH